MDNKLFSKIPGGRLKRIRNRLRGNSAEHDVYCRLERRKVLSQVLDAEFAETVAEVMAKDSADRDRSLWTVLTPGSGFHSRIWVIEGDRDQAIRVYASRNGGRHPEKVSCECGCGADYFLTESYGSLREATMAARHCPTRMVDGEMVFVESSFARKEPRAYEYRTLEQFLAQPNVVLIRDSEVTDEERQRELPPVTGPWCYSPEERTLAWLMRAEM